jgi:hypothetical protein
MVLGIVLSISRRSSGGCHETRNFMVWVGFFFFFLQVVVGLWTTASGQREVGGQPAVPGPAVVHSLLPVYYCLLSLKTLYRCALDLERRTVGAPAGDRE